MRTDRRALLLLAGASFAALPAVGAAPPRVHVVALKDMAFGPLPQDLRVGDVIEWVNADIFQHTATARDRSFDVELKPKARARTVLRKPGVLAVYCRYHPGMTAKAQVRR